MGYREWSTTHLHTVTEELSPDGDLKRDVVNTEKSQFKLPTVTCVCVDVMQHGNQHRDNFDQTFPWHGTCFMLQAFGFSCRSGLCHPAVSECFVPEDKQKADYGLVYKKLSKRSRHLLW